MQVCVHPLKCRMINLERVECVGNALVTERANFNFDGISLALHAP